MKAPADHDRPIPEVFASAKIYFGHQSVGQNILEGIGALQRANPELAAIRIVALPPAPEIDGPGLYHSRLGKNRDIPSKLAAFEDILIRQDYGRKFDLALMKLCYVDIVADTDVAEVFRAYAGTIERIAKHARALRIIHCTVPLTVHATGLKSRLRNWIKGDLPNANRSKFNAMIRRYSSDVFDIAEIEATRPDGSAESFQHQGDTCYAACHDYMDGAGHLNESGARHAAQKFLQRIGALAHRTVPEGKSAA